MATLYKTRQQYIQHIKNRHEFKSSTGNLKGYWDNNGDYVVNSYETHIAFWLSDEGKWYLNERKYSNTTTHHQTIVRMALLNEYEYEKNWIPNWTIWQKKS